MEIWCWFTVTFWEKVDFCNSTPARDYSILIFVKRGLNFTGVCRKRLTEKEYILSKPSVFSACVHIFLFYHYGRSLFDWLCTFFCKIPLLLLFLNSLKSLCMQSKLSDSAFFHYAKHFSVKSEQKRQTVRSLHPITHYFTQPTSSASQVIY